MSIREHLPPDARKELKEVRWTKRVELARPMREWCPPVGELRQRGPEHWGAHLSFSFGRATRR